MTVPTRIAESHFRHTQAPCLQKSEACCDVAGRRAGVGGSGGGGGAALTAAAALDVLGVAGGCLAAALARGANCGRGGPCCGATGPADGAAIRGGWLVPARWPRRLPGALEQEDCGPPSACRT